MRLWYHVKVDANSIDQAESKLPELLNGSKPVQLDDGVHGTVSFNWDEDSYNAEIARTKEYVEDDVGGTVVQTYLEPPNIFHPQ